METAEPGSAAVAAPASGREAPLLDITTDKCALPPYLERAYCRSGWDRRGGGRARHLAHQRFFLAALSSLQEASPAGLVPYFVTLTVDRRPYLNAYPTEVEAARHAFWELGDKVRFFCRRCRVDWWIKALEWQSRTGSGWAHWHLVMFFPDHLSADQVRELVRARWSGVGGGYVTVHKAYRKNGRWENLAGYVAKYVLKGMEAVPPVLDHPDFIMAPRTYSMSKRVSAFVRSLSPPRRRRFRSEPRQRRELAPIYERLAQSGCRSVVVQEEVSTVTGECRPRRLTKPMPFPDSIVTLALERGVLGSPVFTMVGRMKDGLRYAVPGGAAALQAFVDAEGEEIELAFCEEVWTARNKMRHDWDEMQRVREEEERKKRESRPGAGRNPPAGAQRRRSAASRRGPGAKRRAEPGGGDPGREAAR
jgi:hypothetical protein